MRENFEVGILPMMDCIYKIIEGDVELMEWLNEVTMGMFPMFALSWVLTIFSHDLENFS